MKDFPMFMKNELNHIPNNQQNTKDIDGYWFEGKDGSQVAYWTYYANSVSAEHVHDFDEYTICVCGEYLITINGEKIVLYSGDEYYIPKGVVHGGGAKAGTRTIHAFGGKRVIV